MKLEGVPIRKEVLIFAALMERKLREHDARKGKRGWDGMSPDELLQRVHEEMIELEHVHDERKGRPADIAPRAADEAVDVANMLMMYVDSIGQLPPPGMELVGYEEPPLPIDTRISPFDLTSEQFKFTREIFDLTGVQPRLFCDSNSSPNKRGRFRVEFTIPTKDHPLDREVEGPELVVLLRKAARDARAARQA